MVLTGHNSVMEENFRIKSYGFQELATQYLPNIQPKSASIRIRTWIARNPLLSDRLNQLGFIKGTRILTPEMVREIIRIICEP